MPGLKSGLPTRLSLPLFFLVLLSQSVFAKVYYINKGVKFHIGDNKYRQSGDPKADAGFVGTFPLVGREWIVAFRVDQDDEVRVRIENIWGIDDCPYCDDEIFINDKPLARLWEKNNYKPYKTERTYPVHRGETYYLKIASLPSLRGSSEVNDWVFENVVVETAFANVTVLSPSPIIKNPEQPLPKFVPPPVAAGPCDNLSATHVWVAPDKTFQLQGGADFCQPIAMSQILENECLDVNFKIDSVVPGGDQVSQPLEILVGDEKPNGWVLSFEPGKDKLLHGNVILHGIYRANSFKFANYQPGKWNTLRLSYCRDHSVHLSMNGKDVQDSLPEMIGALKVKARAMQLQASFTYENSVAQGTVVDAASAAALPPSNSIVPAPDSN